ncbi:hypothetical protein B0A55_10336 [Friedmanniomyces simplex]|uniref:Uncharacterized protein n=1 Tax=Friedmanniomyces simplex TaxID=329884 RepID=A0A4U0X9V9_9PEZI|nr:hypothetical protein B0A55_10336 [Friedmanniomyces simplex]
MSYLDPEKGHAKSEISASIGTESEAPQRPEILTTCRITSEVRHGCIIFRVYPNVHERRTPPTDNTRDSSKPVLHAVGATIYGTHAGPPIWIPELHDTSSAAATIPEGQPIRCFVASPAGATPTSSGTCSMLFETQPALFTETGASSSSAEGYPASSTPENAVSASFAGGKVGPLASVDTPR